MGKFIKGNIPWCKGLTKEKDERLKEAGIKISKIRKELFKEGKLISPTEGKHHSKETIKKISEKLKVTNVGENHPFYGKNHTEESKLKMSETKKRMYKEGKLKIKNMFNKGHITWDKGIKRPEISGKNNPMYGKENKWGHHTKEAIKRISEKHKGIKKSEESRKRMSETRKELYKEGNLPKFIGAKGKDHINWQGGISFEPYSPEFNEELREQIRKRDNYRCQQCFRHQDELFEKWKNGRVMKRKLDVHHIDFNKKNNNPNNLISLCLNCHMQTNFNREGWTNYFQERIGEYNGK